MKITTSLMFLSDSILRAFSFLLVSHSCSVTLCLAFTRSLSVTRQVCPIDLQLFDCYLQVSDACRAGNRQMIVEHEIQDPINDCDTHIGSQALTQMHTKKTHAQLEKNILTNVCKNRTCSCSCSAWSVAAVRRGLGPDRWDGLCRGPQSKCALQKLVSVCFSG